LGEEEKRVPIPTLYFQSFKQLHEQLKKHIFTGQYCNEFVLNSKSCTVATKCQSITFPVDVARLCGFSVRGSTGGGGNEPRGATIDSNEKLSNMVGTRPKLPPIEFGIRCSLVSSLLPSHFQPSSTYSQMLLYQTLESPQTPKIDNPPSQPMHVIREWERPPYLVPIGPQPHPIYRIDLEFCDGQGRPLEWTSSQHYFVLVLEVQPVPSNLPTATTTSACSL
jgi:hypothetical protein